MKYFSIDTETTGLNPDEHQLLQIGIVFENSLKPKDIKILPKLKIDLLHEQYLGETEALLINKKLIEDLQNNHFPALIKDEDNDLEYHRIMASDKDHVNEIINNFVKRFIQSNKLKLNIAGKNFPMFDYRFLKINNITSITDNIRHRIIDPMHYYVKYRDDSMPSLKTCLTRAGINTEVQHDAIEDALDVIRLLRLRAPFYKPQNNQE